MPKAVCASVPSFRITFALVIGAFASGVADAWAAQDCPTNAAEIATDRPDVTNSSLVVPRGSLQVENGINGTARRGSNAISGRNTRLAPAGGHCTQAPLPPPHYFPPVLGRSLALPTFSAR